MEVARERLNKGDIIKWTRGGDIYGLEPKCDYRPFKEGAERIQFLYISNKLAEIPVALNGHTYTLQPELSHIAKIIEESRSILNLDEGWDGDEAKKIDHTVWISAGEFLVNYSNFIHQTFATIIKSPVFNPGPDGSIDLSWRTRQARFLINFKTKENKYLATYYGDLYNNVQPIKGALLDNEVLRYLAFWMQNLV